MAEVTIVRNPRPRVHRRHTYSPIRCPRCYFRRAYRSKYRGPYDMNWPLPAGAHLLAPFDHQVAGQSSMLRYDESTVCKPLITREHFVYQTLPEGLKEFTPDYRGELEVGLAEKDGYLQLYGLCVKDDSNEDICQCSLLGNPWEDTPLTEVSPGKEAISQLSSEIVPNELGGQNRCVIRVLRSGSYEICSPTNEDISAQASPNSISLPVKTPNLNPWSLKNHKRLLDKMRKGKHRHHSFRCILLKNVVADFKYPCILDLKIGSRLHGDEAIPAKVESQSKKCAETTSNTIGVRLCGMQVYQKGTGQYINLDKYQGRLLTDETFKRTLVHFLHNGIRYRSELLQPIVSKLSSLIDCLRKVDTFRFYASSLLIIYDGLEEGMDDEILLSKPLSNVDNSVFSHGPEQCSKLVNGHDLLSSSSAEGVKSEDMVVNSTSKQSHELNGYTDIPSDLQKNCRDVGIKHPSQPSVSCSVKYEKECVHNPTAINNVQNICDSNSTSSPYKSKSNSEMQSVSDLCPSSYHCIPDSHACSNLNNLLLDQTLKPCDYQKYTIRQNHHSGDFVQDKLFNHSSPSNSYKPLHSPSSCLSGVSRQSNTNAQQVYKVDVKMIDFAHTTHHGFPDDKCRHEGPDIDYIRGLTNLMTLFENLMAEC